MQSLKRLTLLQLLIVIATTLQAQNLRDEIAIVRAHPGTSMVSTYESMAAWLEELREYDLENEMRGRALGSHGSSFSYNGEDGQRYFITNYHVIAGAGDISLEWQPIDGSEPLIIEGCTVLYSDPFRDLALIGLPDGVDVPGQGLEIIEDKGSVNDGMEIWAAGYPGLISSPVWQLSKGIVSNQSALVKELAREGRPYLIQHTSVVDPGSSGGPLMIKQGSEYRVIGVNAMMANYRNNTFFSIPSSSLNAFISEFQEGAATPSQESLEEKLDRFTDLLSSDSTESHELSFYISDEYSLTIGWDLYLERRRRMGFDDRDKWDRAIVIGNSLRGLKNLISEDLKQYSDPMGVSWRIGNYNTVDAEVFIAGGDGSEIRTLWTFEKGVWVLSGYPVDIEKREAEEVPSSPDTTAAKSRRLAYRSGIGFFAGGSYGFGKDGSGATGLGGFSLGVEFLLMHNRYFGSSYIFSYEQYKLVNRDYEENFLAYDPGVAGFGYQLSFYPAKLVEAHRFFPFIRAGAGIGFNIRDFGDSEGSPLIGYLSAAGGLQFKPEKGKGVFSAMVEAKSVGSLMNMGDYAAGGLQLGLILSYIISR